MMRCLKTLVLAMALCGCQGNSGHVEFLFRNFGPNLVCVEEIAGLPPVVACGNLVPARDTNRLSQASMSFHSSIDVEDELIIKWSEGDSPHSLKVSRTALGLPRRLTEHRVQFTYLGNQQWHVKLLE